MPQITIYLDAKTAAQVNTAARAAGLSKSRWIAEAIRARAGSEWPPSVAALHGAWPDSPDLAQVRRNAGRDRKRKSL